MYLTRTILRGRVRAPAWVVCARLRLPVAFAAIARAGLGFKFPGVLRARRGNPRGQTPRPMFVSCGLRSSEMWLEGHHSQNILRHPVATRPAKAIEFVSWTITDAERYSPVFPELANFVLPPGIRIRRSKLMVMFTEACYENWSFHLFVLLSRPLSCCRWLGQRTLGMSLSRRPQGNHGSSAAVSGSRMTRTYSSCSNSTSTRLTIVARLFRRSEKVFSSYSGRRNR